VREFPFELRLAAHLEATRDAIIARQIGASVHAANRVMDLLLVESGPEFDARTAITPETIPDAAIEADVGPGRARYWKDCFDDPTEYTREAVDRAVEVGYLERERRNRRAYVRATARYPDWFARLVGIENKPDLGTPGDLESQLRKDASLRLCDEVILATESYVTGAHLNRIPEAVGVWRVDFDAPHGERIEVVREPEPLDVEGSGLEVVEEHTGRTDVRVATPAEKARARRKMAERAYGKGWRTYEFPACGAIEDGAVAGVGGLPYCAFKERLVDPANCGPSCPGHDPADPPDVDLRSERDASGPWVGDPQGRSRRQARLDGFR
jgi:hypothetical protein